MRWATSTALCATLGLTGGAGAAEDGGTRSVLAAGAGARPLALGGAFVAIADDPSALIWNPAGLTLTARMGFEAAHAQRSELGASHDYAAWVLPSWQWGVAAIGLHHVGIGGIERRDERNVVLEGELASGETEFALGYARNLGEAWSLGGAVKLQSQSLGGFGASALAADLGFLVSLGQAFGDRAPWLQGVTTGLAVRNMLEPTLRLDRESVTDPRVWRFGLAWAGSRPGSRALRVAFDLDHSAGVRPRPHAGAELSLHPLLALRGGLNAGRPTAGVGLKWRDFDVSYGFEDMSVAPVHRVGLAHSFGSTVTAKREAARRAEEERVQARLDDAFERRRREQMDDLLGRAEEAIVRSDFRSALELLATAATLDSADARVRSLQARGEREQGLSLEAAGDFGSAAAAFERALALAPEDTTAQAGVRRSRAKTSYREAMDAQRQRTLERALDALARGDLTAAKSGFRALVGADSGDTEAWAMLRRTEDAIQRQVAELVRLARRSVEARSPAEAERLLARARALDPSAHGIGELLAAIEGLTGPNRGQTTPDRARSARPSDRREADALFRRGVGAISGGRPDDALRYWELALSLDPDHQGARRSLNREYLVRGMNAYAAGRLDEAVGHWERARRAEPGDPQAEGFLQRARERQERARAILGGDR